MKYFFSFLCSFVWLNHYKVYCNWKNRTNNNLWSVFTVFFFLILLLVNAVILASHWEIKVKSSVKLPSTSLHLINPINHLLWSQLLAETQLVVRRRHKGVEDKPVKFREASTSTLFIFDWDEIPALLISPSSFDRLNLMQLLRYDQR